MALRKLTTLLKIQELLVIARNSSFVFKGQARDIREIGRLLGARYVVEGSARKAGNRVRLTAQLIDSLNGHHLWADHFDGNLDDVFDLQDRITQEIAAALEVRLAGRAGKSMAEALWKSARRRTVSQGAGPVHQLHAPHPRGGKEPRRESAGNQS
jgi:hypothetical protein